MQMVFWGCGIGHCGCIILSAVSRTASLLMAAFIFDFIISCIVGTYTSAPTDMETLKNSTQLHPWASETHTPARAK